MSKRPLFRVMILLIVVTISWFTYYLWPTSVDEKLEGIEYRLGPKQPTLEEPVTIRVKGTLKNYLFAHRTFTGTIQLDDQRLPPKDASEDELVITLGTVYGKGGAITYGEQPLDPHTFGFIIIDDDFSKLTIGKVEGRTEEESGWNGADGVTISAPASTREEAVQLTNELMSHLLVDPLD